MAVAVQFHNPDGNDPKLKLLIMQLEDHYSELALNLPLCNLTKIAVVRNVWQHLCVQGHVHIGHCVLLHVCVQRHVCTAAFVCAGSCAF